MIVTNKPHVPWSWVWLSQLPFAFWMFAIQVNGTVVQLSLKKFVENPAVIALTISVASIPVLIIAPIVSFLSDHIWTRFGRRKPFYIGANIASGIFIICMPFAQSYWALATFYWLYYTASAFGKTFFPLSQEVIPIPQRGRGAAIHQIMFQAGLVLFYMIVIGRFNDVYSAGPLTLFGPLSGEAVIYILCGLGMLLPVLIIGYGLKELPLPHMRTLRDEGGFNLIRFMKDFFVKVFDRQWLPLYLLLFSATVYNCFQPLIALLYTEQWGYSTQALGFNIGVGCLICMPFIIWIGRLADRGNKMRLFIGSSMLTAFFTLGYYLYVMILLPDHRPSLLAIWIFGQLIAIPKIMADTVQWPLIFEYVSRPKMGTASGGIEMMGGIFGVVLTPLAGLWVTGYSLLFMPGAGSEVRVTLAEAANQNQVAQILSVSSGSAGRDEFILKPWSPPGQKLDVSRVWTIRERDPQGDNLYATTQDAEKERDTLLKAQVDARRSQDAGKLEAATARVEAASQKAAQLRADLVQRADLFRAKVTALMNHSLVIPGDELTVVDRNPATLVIVTASRRLSRRDLETLQTELKTRFPALLGVIVHPKNPLKLAVLFPQPVTGGFSNNFVTSLEAIATTPAIAGESTGGWFGDSTPVERRRQLAGLFGQNAHIEIEQRPRIHFTLSTLSPPSAENLTTMEKGLQDEGVNLVRLSSRTASPGIEIEAIFLSSPTQLPVAPSVDEAVWKKFLAGGEATETNDATRGLQLYDKIVQSAAGVNIVIPRPVIKSGYAPRAYDYFSGYLLQFLGVLTGVVIAFYVTRLERRGIFRKLGVEEDAQNRTGGDESAANPGH